MSSPQKSLMLMLAERISAAHVDGLETYFSADFRLHDPAAPEWPRGAAGARLMLSSFMALGDDVRLRVLDMVEEGDKLAVRWQVSFTREGVRHRAAIMAIYRFDGGRIAEDWGLSRGAPWP